MMGHKVFFTLFSIAFLGLFGVYSQEAKTEQVGANTQIEVNTVVGENGLIGIVPPETVSTSDTNIIAVVPGVELPDIGQPSIEQPSTEQPNANLIQNTIQTVQSAPESEVLIGVVPNSSIGIEDEESIASENNIDVGNPPIISNEVAEIVQEEVIVPVTVNKASDVQEDEVATFAQSEEVIPESVIIEAVNSNVSEYVQDAIQNVIYETAPVNAEQHGSEQHGSEQKNIVSDTVPENMSDTPTAVEAINEALEVVDATEANSALQKVTIAVSEKTQEDEPAQTFEVKTQAIDRIDNEPLASEFKTNEWILTDIEKVGAAFDYGQSFTAENSFIGDLIAMPLPSSLADGVVGVEEETQIEIAAEDIRTEDVETEDTETEIVEEVVSEVAVETVEEIVESPDESPENDLTEIAKGTQFMGKLDLNDSVDDVLATDISEAVFHTYQLDVPVGQEVLTIMVESQSGDVDFAVKAGSEITSYVEVDYIDNSGNSTGRYSYQFPPSGPIFIDVMNYTEEPVAYALSVSDDYDDAVSSSYDGSTDNILAVRNRASATPVGPLGTGHFFDLKLNSVLSREIVAKEASATMTYHSYEVALPKALDNVEVILDGQGHDVDMAVRLGEAIVRLDEVDFIDISSADTSSYLIEAPEETVVYIDVMNYLQEAAHYELQIIADGVDLESTLSTVVPVSSIAPDSTADSDNARSYAPSMDDELANIDETVTRLNTGQPYEGLIANYLKIGQERSAMAESQSFLLEVPEGAERFVVTLASNEDLDLALKFASPIESYALKKQGGDWDYLDMRPTTNSRIQVEAPAAGFWYIDVIQATYGQGAAPYTLQVFYP